MAVPDAELAFEQSQVPVSPPDDATNWLFTEAGVLTCHPNVGPFRPLRPRITMQEPFPAIRRCRVPTPFGLMIIRRLIRPD